MRWIINAYVDVCRALVSDFAKFDQGTQAARRTY